MSGTRSESGAGRPAGVRRIETENSVYLLDEVLMRYMRLPRAEGGRAYWEMTGRDSPWMQDGRWLPYDRAERFCSMSGVKRVVILYPGARRGIVTTAILSDSSHVRCTVTADRLKARARPSAFDRGPGPGQTGTMVARGD